MAFSALLIRLIDWCYIRPVAALMPRQMFRYAVCGVANVLIGWVIYFLVYNFALGKELLDLGFTAISAHVAAMLITFPVTFFVGFWLNREVAFRHSPVSTRAQLFRYLLTILGSLVINYFALKLFVEVCSIWATPSQMLATLITTIYSFFAAKYYSFRHAEKE